METIWTELKLLFIVPPKQSHKMITNGDYNIIFRLGDRFDIVK